MGTPLQDVYDKFLVQIEDDVMAIMEDTLRNELLRVYLDMATSKFKECEQSLKIEGDCFVSDLSGQEQLILSYNMILVWLSPKILCTDNLALQFSDADWNQKNPATLLATLLSLRRYTTQQAELELIDYSYKDGSVGWC